MAILDISHCYGRLTAFFDADCTVIQIKVIPCNSQEYDTITTLHLFSPALFLSALCSVFLPAFKVSHSISEIKISKEL